MGQHPGPYLHGVGSLLHQAADDGPDLPGLGAVQLWQHILEPTHPSTHEWAIPKRLSITSGFNPVGLARGFTRQQRLRDTGDVFRWGSRKPGKLV
jgi:hypothetical protein